eukprot:379088-Rhodomonas_salina.1
MATEVGEATEVDAEALSSENVYWIDFRCVQLALRSARCWWLLFCVPPRAPRIRDPGNLLRGSLVTAPFGQCPFFGSVSLNALPAQPDVVILLLQERSQLHWKRAAQWPFQGWAVHPRKVSE